jgi:uncharacterized protein involved in exopolysaccharide biosynthesis
MQKNKYIVSEENEETFTQRLLSKYIPYWPLILFSLFLAIGVAYAYLKFATPIYEANATLIIVDEKKGMKNLR